MTVTAEEAMNAAAETMARIDRLENQNAAMRAALEACQRLLPHLTKTHRVEPEIAVVDEALSTDAGKGSPVIGGPGVYPNKPTCGHEGWVLSEEHQKVCEMAQEARRDRNHYANKLEQAQAEAAAAGKALRRYGRHLDSCEKKPCRCGFTPDLNANISGTAAKALLERLETNDAQIEMLFCLNKKFEAVRDAAEAHMIYSTAETWEEFRIALYAAKETKKED